MAELKRLLCCSLRSSHFWWRHTSRAAKNGVVLHSYEIDLPEGGSIGLQDADPPTEVVHELSGTYQRPS